MKANNLRGLLFVQFGMDHRTGADESVREAQATAETGAVFRLDWALRVTSNVCPARTLGGSFKQSMWM